MHTITCTIDCGTCMDVCKYMQESTHVCMIVYAGVCVCVCLSIVTLTALLLFIFSILVLSNFKYIHLLSIIDDTNAFGTL